MTSVGQRTVRFPDVVALVTGDGSRLARTIAFALADEGADVAVVAVAETTAADLEQTLGGIRARGRRGWGVCVPRPEVPQRAGEVVAAVEAELGPVDIVISAPRLLTVVPAVALTEQDWDEAIAANLDSVFALLQAVIPRMTARGGGRVVVVTGEEARLGANGRSHVAAASWAVVGLAKSVALEVADHGVRVNVVVAGPIDEPATAQATWGVHAAGVGGGRDDVEHALRVLHPISEAWVDAADVAEAALYLSSPAAGRLTGVVLDVTLGTSARNSV